MYMPPPSPPSPMHAGGMQQDFNQKRLGGKPRRFNFEGNFPPSGPGGPGGPMGSPPPPYQMYAHQQMSPYLTGPAGPSHMTMSMVAPQGSAYGPPGGYGQPMRNNFNPLGGQNMQQQHHELDHSHMSGPNYAQHGMDPNMPPPMMKNMFTNA